MGRCPCRSAWPCTQEAPPRVPELLRLGWGWPALLRGLPMWQAQARMRNVLLSMVGVQLAGWNHQGASFWS